MKSKKQFILFVAMVISTLLLSSCTSTTSSSWDCPRQNGVGCINISEADSGHSHKNSNCKNGNCNKQSKEQKKIAKQYKKQLLKNLKTEQKQNKKKNKNKSKNEKLQDLMTISSDNPLRSSERVSRVLFAPFIDSSKNKHEQSIVYYIEKQPNWK